LVCKAYAECFRIDAAHSRARKQVNRVAADSCNAQREDDRVAARMENGRQPDFVFPQARVAVFCGRVFLARLSKMLSRAGR